MISEETVGGSLINYGFTSPMSCGIQDEALKMPEMPFRQLLFYKYAANPVLIDKARFFTKESYNARHKPYYFCGQ